MKPDSQRSDQTARIPATILPPKEDPDTAGVRRNPKVRVSVGDGIVGVEHPGDSAQSIPAIQRGAQRPDMKHPGRDELVKIFNE